LFSLFITIIIFYNPLWGLWSRIMGELIRVPIRLGRILININIPNTGFILLILYSVAFWFGLSELLRLIEKHLKIDFLKKMDLRNGMFYAYLPNLIINTPFVLAKIFLPLLILKGVLTFLLNWIKVLIFGNFRLLNIVSIILEFLRGRFNVNFEFVTVSLCILLIIADRFIKTERINRQESDLLDVGRNVRKSVDIEIPATQDID